MRRAGRFRVRDLNQWLAQSATLGLFRSNDSNQTIWNDLVV